MQEFGSTDYSFQNFSYSEAEVLNDSFHVMSAGEITVYKEGYELAGWTLADAASGIIPGIFIECGRSLISLFDQYGGNQLTLWPVFEPCMYHIMYNCPEMFFIEDNPQNYSVNDDVSLRCITIDGIEYNWVFEDSNEPCTGWHSGERTGDVNLSVNGVYPIRYNVGENEINDERNPLYYFADQNVTLYAPTTTREGYEFAGWYMEKPYFSSEPLTGWEAGAINHEVLLVARWTNPTIESILGMTESGTIAINGNITYKLIFDIRDALLELNSQNSQIKVGLDFSEATSTEEGLCVDFNDCRALTSITLNNYFWSIDSLSNTRINTITIPDSVMYISQGAFIKCTRLTSVAFESNSTWVIESATGQITINTADYSAEDLAVMLKQTYCNYDWQKITH